MANSKLSLREFCENAKTANVVRVSTSTEFARMTTKEMNNYLRANRTADNYDLLDAIFNAKINGDLEPVYKDKVTADGKTARTLTDWNFTDFDGKVKSISVAECPKAKIEGLVSIDECRDIDALRTYFKNFISEIQREY